MFLFKFWSYILGYVSVIVEGKGLEKFVNMAISRGIYLWDITKLSNGRLQIKARVSSFRALRHICRRVGCRMKIHQKNGLPFVALQIKRRKMMVAGAIVFLCTLYFLSSIVWFVEVKGNKTIPADTIIKLARQQGVKPGEFKWNIKVDQVQKELIDRVEGAAFVGVEIKGTKVIIDVAEKVMPPSEEERLPAHIVAQKAGLIKEILVLKGEPTVKEGDLVREGQVLITGEIWPKKETETETKDKDEKDKPKDPGKPELVRAKGNVRARIWYEGYGEAQIVEEGNRKTGVTTNTLSIKIFGKEIIVKGPKKSPYKLSSAERRVKRLPQWRNIKFPVELINTKYYELEAYRIENGPDKAEKMAEEKALESINRKMPPKKKILEKKVEEIRTYDDNLVRVKATIETLEEIGKAELIKK